MSNQSQAGQSTRSPVDMSPEAVSERLHRCAALSELCIKLKNAKMESRDDTESKESDEHTA